MNPTSLNLDQTTGTQATALMVLVPKATYAEIIPERDWDIDFSKALEITQTVALDKFNLARDNKRSHKLINAIGFAIRSRSFEDLLDKYLDIHPDAVVVQFGCGLSDRSERYKEKIKGGLPFFDIDFPNIIEARKNFYEEGHNYHMLATDLSSYTWIETIRRPFAERPFIFIAEGVSPYLSEAQMKELFATLTAEFPGCILIFDVYSQLKLRGAQKILKERFDASLEFFNDDPSLMLAWSPNGEYRLLDEDVLIYRKDFLTHKHLPTYYRWLMKFIIRWFSGNKGLIRGTVTLAMQLGK